jgi:hypothetical protein
MPNPGPEYDVAISFLARDEAAASALYRQLSQTLKVFFFPRNQEELAGTDGMVSMREPFLKNSRVIVVLYRESWGKTPWTRIEQTAIQEACLAEGWAILFFVALDRTDTLPSWLPTFWVRFNWEDFGLDEAVGAIRARALEKDAELSRLTPAKRVKMFAEDQLYRADKADMASSAGMKAIKAEILQLFELIERQCNEPGIREALAEFKTEKAERSIFLTTAAVGLIVIWQQQYENLLENAWLSVQEYDSHLILKEECSRFVQPLTCSPQFARIGL